MQRQTVPRASLYIDLSFGELLGLYGSFFRSHDREKYLTTLNQLWGSNILVTLCVRTAFDLFLTVKSFPKGSQVHFVLFRSGLTCSR